MKIPPKGFANNETGFIKWMTEDEFNLVLTGLRNYEFNYRLIFFIMFYMGLRIGEVVELKYSDIVGNYEKLRITLKKTHNIIERIIPEIVKKELDIYVFVQKPFRTNDYLFEPRAGHGSKNPHLSPLSINWRLKEIRQQLGLDDYYFTRKDGKKLARITPHTFRHSFLTRFYNKSQDIILTQRVIGHKKIETTARYIFNHLEKEKEIVNAI